MLKIGTKIGYFDRYLTDSPETKFYIIFKVLTRKNPGKVKILKGSYRFRSVLFLSKQAHSGNFNRFLWETIGSRSTAFQGSFTGFLCFLHICKRDTITLSFNKKVHSQINHVS